MVQRLKMIRRLLHYSQEQMAGCLHISRQAYGLYERGEREPPLSFLLNFSDTFAISVDYLLARDDRPAPVCPGEEELLLLFRSLDPSGQEYILSQARYEQSLAQIYRAEDHPEPKPSSVSPPAGVKAPNRVPDHPV